MRAEINHEVWKHIFQNSLIDLGGNDLETVLSYLRKGMKLRF